LLISENADSALGKISVTGCRSEALTRKINKQRTDPLRRMRREINKQRPDPLRRMRLTPCGGCARGGHDSRLEVRGNGKERLRTPHRLSALHVSFEAWIFLVGGLLLMLGSSGWILRRVPFITPAMLYLGMGAALGPWWWNVITIDPVTHQIWLHRGAEIAVIVSLFTVGLKVRLPLNDRRWRAPILLATLAMLLTVGLVTVIGVLWLGLSLGAALLLGAVLAPTDPVLASDVQVRHATDRDRMRFTLSVEAGLNDGTAFPFVMLGLGLLGLHPLGEAGWRWWSVDVLWAVAGGLVLGAGVGYGIGKWVLWLGGKGYEGTGVAIYLVGGTIGVSYSVALLLHTYGFLAVFAAAVALRSIERRATGDDTALEALPGEASELSPGRPVEERVAAVRFTAALLRLSESVERLLEIGMVILVGAALGTVGISPENALFALVLFIVVRPLAVLPVQWAVRFPASELAAVGWFGIRGVGSVYYLFYALGNGVLENIGEALIATTLSVVALSILIHGLSVGPALRLMDRKQIVGSKVRAQR
jgi:sodium/hydrogen antiporter